MPFRIVPGITAGIGGLAYAGIPVTHRDTNHAVTFITGHGADGKLPRLDWAAVAQGSETLVLYMARKFAGEIAQDLMAAGREAGRTRRHRRQCGARRPERDRHHLGGLARRGGKSAGAVHHRDRRECAAARELDWLSWLRSSRA